MLKNNLELLMSFAVEVSVVRQRLSVHVQLPTECGVPKPAA